MSPIRPEERGRYPIDWPVIALRIKGERAEGRCECDGRCGRTVPEHAERDLGYRPESTWNDAPRRCTARHGEPSAVSGAPVVLTVAHLDHQPEHSDDSNLRAMCQACHLAYDAPHHAETRAARSGATSAPLTLFDT